MQAAQKLGIVYIGKAGGKVRVDLFFWICFLILCSSHVKREKADLRIVAGAR